MKKLKVEDMLAIVLKGQYLSNTKPEHRWSNIEKYLSEINPNTGNPNIFNKDNYAGYLYNKKVVNDFRRQERIKEVKRILEQLQVLNIFLFIEYIFLFIPTTLVLILYALSRKLKFGSDPGKRQADSP